MTRKKTAAMEARIDEVERRLQEMEARSQLRLEEHAVRIEQIVATALQRAATTDPGNPGNRPERNGTTNEGERRLRKIDLPVFNGEDATGWLTKIERFFKVRRIEEEEKLDAAMMAVEGEALSWLQWWEASTEELTWDALKDAILRRFQPTVITNAFEILMSMKQEGTVREYRKNFETVSSHVKVKDQDLFVGLFSNGLREDIRAEVRLHRPKDLAEMMDVALLAEEKIGAVGRYGGQNKQSWSNKGYNNNRNWHPDGVAKANTESATMKTEVKGQETVKVNQPNGARSIGGKEIEEKRRKGLCFTCGEKYTPSHVCKNKMFRILYMEEGGEEQDSDKKGEEEEEIVWGGDLKSLLLCSMAGLSSKSSFMIKATIGTLEVIVLVDCGATHNFVSMKLVAGHNWKVEDTPPLGEGGKWPKNFD